MHRCKDLRVATLDVADAFMRSGVVDDQQHGATIVNNLKAYVDHTHAKMLDLQVLLVHCQVPAAHVCVFLIFEHVQRSLPDDALVFA